MRNPIHPGETLREDLDALGMSEAELARRIEVPVNRITEILKGRRAVTGDTALRLGRFVALAAEDLAPMLLAVGTDAADMAALSEAFAVPRPVTGRVGEAADGRGASADLVGV
ncbi:MAG: HigA family addiction module antitoxin [bacterium]|nr:HigA family addiction module antitoxin [bacterium]